MDAQAKQLDLIFKLLKFLHNFQAVSAALIFLILSIESFGAAPIGNGSIRDAVLFILSFFLVQSGTLYFMSYQRMRKTAFAKTLESFLILLTFLPLVLVIGACLAFLFRAVPSVHLSYSMAFLFLVGFSWIYFRSLLAEQFPSSSQPS